MPKVLQSFEEPSPAIVFRYESSQARKVEPMMLVDVTVNGRPATLKVAESEVKDFCARHGVPVPDNVRPARRKPKAG